MLISVVLGPALSPLKPWAGLGHALLGRAEPGLEQGPEGAQGSGFGIFEPEPDPWARAYYLDN